MILAPTVHTQAARDTVKNTILSQGGSGANFFAIDVATPLAYCEENDRKGVYARARAGGISGVAGVDVEFEPFERAQLTVDVTKQNIPEIVHSALFFLLALMTCSGTDLYLSSFKASSSSSRRSRCCRWMGRCRRCALGCGPRGIISVCFERISMGRRPIF